MLDHYILEFVGYSATPSRCLVRFFKPQEQVIVVVSQIDGALAYLGKNQGTSVTNAAELLAGAIREKLAQAPFRMIEHYPPRGQCLRRRNAAPQWELRETFAEVVLTWNAASARFQQPTWKYCPRSIVEELIQEPLLDLPQDVPVAPSHYSLRTKVHAVFGFSDVDGK